MLVDEHSPREVPRVAPARVHTGVAIGVVQSGAQRPLSTLLGAEVPGVAEAPPLLAARPRIPQVR